ncbi:MAG: hypothetical protein ACTSO3_16175 [Candidatus Heimdallarchaeaceae archaeon]
MTNNEYSFEDLSSKQRTNAIFQLDQTIRTRLGLPTGARSVNASLMECMIKMLDPIFNYKGKIVHLSKKFKTVSNELLRKIYGTCNSTKKIYENSTT